MYTSPMFPSTSSQMPRTAMRLHHVAVVSLLLLAVLLQDGHVASAAFLFPWTNRPNTSNTKSSSMMAMMMQDARQYQPQQLVQRTAYQPDNMYYHSTASLSSNPLHYDHNHDHTVTSLRRPQDTHIMYPSLLSSSSSSSADFLQHAPSSMSTLSSALLHGTTAHADMHNNIRLPTADMIEPYINLFIPTYRCSTGLFCRAVLTAYHNRETGHLNIMAGYTIFTIVQEDVDRSIPRATRRKVQRTSRREMARYVRLLRRQLQSDLPAACDFRTTQGVKAMSEAIVKMKQCTKLQNGSCNRYAEVIDC